MCQQKGERERGREREIERERVRERERERERGREREREREGGREEGREGARVGGRYSEREGEERGEEGEWLVQCSLADTIHVQGYRKMFCSRGGPRGMDVQKLLILLTFIRLHSPLTHSLEKKKTSSL